MSDAMNERVWTVPRSVCEGLPDVGFLPNPQYIDSLIEDGWIMKPRRGQVENRPEFKHLIVYFLVWLEGNNGERRYLVYQRGQKGEGEDRLASLWSLGIGGHVNGDDTSLRWAVVREYNEELPRFDSYFDRDYPNHIGVINDDSNPVGQVHLGVLYAIKINMVAGNSNNPFVTSPLRNPGFLSAADIRRHYGGRLESWSEIVLREVIEAGVALTRD